MDALLGAAGLGDIGMHFPDTDPAWRGADSIELLEHVTGLVHKAGYKIENVDSTVIAQAPKLGPHRDAMRNSLAKAMSIEAALVNVKFTTSNKDTIDIYKVDSVATCDPAVGGWYYDVPAAPTEVLLCKSTCDTVSASTGASMSVEFGCDSHRPPIR
jgi:hypothetical protein